MMQAYPEFCRKVFDAAPLGFQIAVAELQNKYGKVRSVSVCVWVAPGKLQNKYDGVRS